MMSFRQVWMSFRAERGISLWPCNWGTLERIKARFLAVLGMTSPYGMHQIRTLPTTLPI